MIGISLSSKLMLDSEKSGNGKEEAMDPQKVKEILDLKLKNLYPPNATKNQRYVLKRRAESYQLKGKTNLTMYPLCYCILNSIENIYAM